MQKVLGRSLKRLLTLHGRIARAKSCAAHRNSGQIVKFLGFACYCTKTVGKGGLFTQIIMPYLTYCDQRRLWFPLPGLYLLLASNQSGPDGKNHDASCLMMRYEYNHHMICRLYHFSMNKIIL